jgi:hypothetical protein
MNGISVPDGVDCQVQIVFTPTASGTRTSTTTLAFSNGDVANLSFSGVATPVWSAETAAQSSATAAQTSLAAVWATNGAVHVVGSNNMPSPAIPVALTSSMPGVWNADSTTFGSPLYSVGGSDATHVWAGVDGSFYTWQGTGSWAAQTIAANDAGAPGPMNGVWAASATEAYAVTNAGQVYQYTSGAWKLVGSLGVSLYAISGGAGVANYVVAGGMGLLASSAINPGTLTQLSTGTTAPLRGVWEASANNIFAVGDAPSSSMPGTIIHCTGSPLTCVGEVSPLFNTLTAISGRIDPQTSKPDIWAVGYLGNEVIHSTGDGTWTAVKVPNNQAMHGVFVLPSGEVYAVGDAGEVNHLY